MRALVAGWFSFPGMGTTAGDLLARDVVCEWLNEAGVPHDVALTQPFAGGVDWHTVDPKEYDCVVFVCGPFGNGEPLTGFLDRFAGRRLVGVNLSMLASLASWNPFDVLFERDSSRATRPDVCFVARPRPVPVVGVMLVHAQREYGTRAAHEQVNVAIQRLVSSREMAAVAVDTRLDGSGNGLRTPGEIEALVSRMDVVVTTRLHGLVLALKNGVPAIAIDPIRGGAKVQLQAASVGWPVVFTPDTVSDCALVEAFAYCQTGEARAKAFECRDRAVGVLAAVRQEFSRAIVERAAEDS